MRAKRAGERVLKLSRQPYYRWLAAPIPEADVVEAYRANALFDAHRDDPELGYRYLADGATAAGHPMTKRTAWRLCSTNAWFSAFGKGRAKNGKKPGPPVHDDLCAVTDADGQTRHEFRADAPNQLWLTDISEHPTTAEIQAHGVLIDVAELWELFVLHCAGSATEQSIRHGTTTQSSGYLARSMVDPRHTLGKLYPDILVGEEPVNALLDAKYKRLGGRRGVDREDLYQLHAYSSTFAVPLAALAYPALDDVMPYDECYSPWKTGTGELSFLTLPCQRPLGIAHGRP